MKKEEYFFNNAAEKKRLEIKFDSEQAKQQLLDMGFKRGMKFLDVGCGTGAMLREVKAFDSKNKHIWGIDANKEFLLHAARIASENKRAKYCASNTYRLPFKDNSFDFVWSRLMLEHLVDPLRAIKEMKRVSKKGGIIAIGDLDGNCIFHYPVDKKFERDLNHLLTLLAPYGFDPYIGRKLFHLLLVLHLRKIEVKLYPYHNIYGKPNKKDRINWNIKIKSAIGFLRKHTKSKDNFLKKIESSCLSYIQRKDTFTYSTLIFAKGVK
jgi:SAM-dependent methyltransferase